MKLPRYIATTFLASLFVASLSGCKEGPAEKAGKALDNAVDKTEQQVDKVGDKIEDSAKDARK